MNCDEVQDLLHAYLDEELDVVKTIEVEQHLQTCSACSQAYDRLRALRTAFRTNDLYMPAPAYLRKQVQVAVRKADKTPLFQRRGWFSLSVAALLIVSTLTALTLTQLFSASSGNSALAQQVLASHIRSLQANHLVDVPSSDKHTVKPWFDGKLDYSPPVVDLTAQGFPLIGGRLDYLNNRPVASLVYRRNKHIINLFLWPSQGTSPPVIQTFQGYHLCSWTQSGMTYWAVSDVETSDLQQFVHLIQQQTG